MKTVKSKGDLDKLALSKGGVVTDEEGNKFNSSGVTARPEKRLEPLPQPKKKSPPEPDPGMVMIADAMTDANKATLMLFAELKAQMKTMHAGAQVEQTLITEWDFDFVRDEKGYLSKVKAQAFSYGKPLKAQSIN